MASDVSLEVEVKDNYSVVMDKIAKATRSAGDDMLGLQSKLDALNKTKTTLQIDVQSAKQRLSEAKKSFTETSKAINDTKTKLEAAEQRLSVLNTENAQKEVDVLKQKLTELESSAASTELRTAQDNYNNLASSLSAVALQAKDTERTMRSLNGTANQGGGAINSAAIMNLMRTGVNFASTIITTNLNSSGQPEAATMTNDIVSGAASGAAVGSLFGPVGTVIGAGVGTIAGIIKGNTDVKAIKTDSLAGVIESQFKSTTETVDEWLAAGSQINAQREKDNIAFTKMLGGKDIADSYLENLIEKANHTPFLYSDLTGMSQTLATFGYSPDEMLDMIDKVGDTGAALGMDTSGMVAVATYLGRMKSSGKTTLEYLNPLIERGIPVMDYLSESLKKSKTEVYDMVSKGLIPGEDAAKVIAEYMGHDFSGAMEEISKTYNGLTSTVEGWNQEMENAMGKGYNDTKIPMLEKQIAWFEKNGNKMKQVYYKIGQTNAEAENEGTEAKLKAWDEIIANVDTLDGGQLRAKMAEAETAEYVAYLKSEGYDQMYDAENELINRLSKELADDWAMAGYEQGNLMKEAASAAIKGDGDIVNIGRDLYLDTETGEVLKPLEAKKRKKAKAAGIEYSAQEGTSGRFAFGFPYVPYDDYPVRLHQGERVLTASQNREYSSGMSGGVSVTVNGLVVREEADVDKIANELYLKLRTAAANYSEI